ncbi:hypothetical protein OIU77_014526 [Salix suchowensis]|uniref:Uncharacterized protein n=1 Tax=Salix suchowensis TaxID=1278906 RepID=A0ABQ8ZXR0_9ROSI|nr:hypothetical protein OIU77_014526 [Salix suchowensis]
MFLRISISNTAGFSIQIIKLDIMKSISSNSLPVILLGSVFMFPKDHL